MATMYNLDSPYEVIRQNILANIDSQLIAQCITNGLRSHYEVDDESNEHKVISLHVDDAASLMAEYICKEMGYPTPFEPEA